jgi:hypothetical protein
MYALVDVNNFYTSCETVFRPDLYGKPVVVVSNNDGCIISRSAEAKLLGIKMGAPYFKIKEELRRQNVTVFSSNYALYADLSHRAMLTLTEIAPAVEVYSIDEAFIDISGLSNCISLTTFGHQLRNQVLKNTGLTVGVGIAPTKTLAKLANFAAKNWPKIGGVAELSDHQRQRKLMSKVPVEEGELVAASVKNCSLWALKQLCSWLIVLAGLSVKTLMLFLNARSESYAVNPVLHLMSSHQLNNRLSVAARLATALPNMKTCIRRFVLMPNEQLKNCELKSSFAVL